jgi:hypothetical protein
MREQGDYAEAAEAFSALATRSAEQGKHQMAMHLAIKGAASLAADGQNDAAAAAAVEAARYAAPLQEGIKTSRRFGTLVSRLREKGHGDAADAIEAAVMAHLGLQKLSKPDPSKAPIVNRAMRRRLPKACTTCGAPVEAGKVEFSEHGAADCRFCGVLLTS